MSCLENMVLRCGKFVRRKMCITKNIIKNVKKMLGFKVWKKIEMKNVWNEKIVNNNKNTQK